ncbi:DivIVA domain-containing protein [Amycolatopsis sp. NPDC059027]|uniref:DivIVA domain-containing protein n=1 Tax=unclassified Amycolatopsis TaxID=2618356 RepID=UPI00366F4CC3
MSFTAEDLAEVTFGNAPIGRRGYAKHEVDAFIRRIAKTFAEEDDLTAAEVHHVMFSRPLIGKRGYDEREVDEFLDEVEQQLVTETGRHVPGVPLARVQDEATDERATPEALEEPSERIKER